MSRPCSPREAKALKFDLDDDLEALRTAPLDADLSQIEPRIWLRIGQARRARSVERWLAPMRAGILLAALTAGAALGAASVCQADARRDVVAFDVEADFAPSTLLGQH